MAIKILNDFLEVATPEETGIVRPDGDSITITPEGLITSYIVEVPENIVTSENYPEAKLWKGTLEEYNALATHDPDTTYFITDDIQAIDVIDDDITSYDKTWSSVKISENIDAVIPSNGTVGQALYLKSNSAKPQLAYKDVLDNKYITNIITKHNPNVTLNFEISATGALILKAGSILMQYTGTALEMRQTQNDITAIPTGNIPFAYVICGFNDNSLHIVSPDRCFTFLPDSPMEGDFLYTVSEGIIKRYTGTEWISHDYSFSIASVNVVDSKVDKIYYIAKDILFFKNYYHYFGNCSGYSVNGKSQEGENSTIALAASTLNANISVPSGTYAGRILFKNGTVNPGIVKYSEDDINSSFFNTNTENEVFYNPTLNKITEENSALGPKVYVKDGNIIAMFNMENVAVITRNDSVWATRQVMPSDVSINLTLLASGGVYSIPADGYLIFSKFSTATGQSYAIYNEDKRVLYKNTASSDNEAYGCTVLVRKGMQIHIDYTLAGEIEAFKFVYAEGAF